MNLDDWFNKVMNDEIEVLLNKQYKCYAFKHILETLSRLDLLTLQHITFDRQHDNDPGSYCVSASYEYLPHMSILKTMLTEWILYYELGFRKHIRPQ